MTTIYNVGDYAVGGGTTSDYTAIQNAINAAGAAGGGVVLLGEGTFLIDVTVTVTNANVTIQGSGRGATVIKRKNTTNLKMFTLTSASYTTFRDITFDANDANQSSNHDVLDFDVASAHLTVRDCEFKNCLGYAVFTNNGTGTARATNPRLLHNNFTALASAGAPLVKLFAEGGQSIGNNFNFQNWPGFVLVESNNHPVLANNFYGNGQGGFGLSLESAQFCPVSSNTFALGGATSSDYGIRVIASTETSARASRDVLINGNMFDLGAGQSGNWQGIRIYGVQYCLISNNFMDGAYAGVQFSTTTSDSVTIADNRFSNTGAGGSILETTTPTNKVYLDNGGYNPKGSLGPPTVPASTVTYTNAYGVIAQVWVTGGTLTAIKVDGVTTGVTSGLVIVPAGSTIAITYTVAPTWVWYGG